MSKAYSFNIGNINTQLSDDMPGFQLLVELMIGGIELEAKRKQAIRRNYSRIAMMGELIADAYLKAMTAYRISMIGRTDEDSDLFGNEGGIYLSDIVSALEEIDHESIRGQLLHSFMRRIGDFALFSLTHPEATSAIIERAQALSNERLSERCQSIVENGRDPGVGDLGEWLAPLHCPN